MSYTTTGDLQCDMVADCAGEVTHLDDKGYVYCAAHGSQRGGWRPCRKLRSHEVNKLRRGEVLARY